MMTNKKNSNEFYHNEDTRLALLEHTIGDLNKTLERFEKRFDKIDERFDKVDARFERMDSKIDSHYEASNSKIDSHFRWSIGLIFGLYGTIAATLITAVGKAYHWF